MRWMMMITLSCFSLNAKETEEFRNYNDASERVRLFYKENHEKQTLQFVLEKKEEYKEKNRLHLGVWDAIEYLNQFVDDSDPDLQLPQIQHLLQTAEAMRKDGLPDWFVLTGLMHDLGKILFFFGEEQWAVVGDTFPVGCAFSDKIVYPIYFDANPDVNDTIYSTPLGIYSEGCGFDAVHMSWGHDEYLYQVVKDYLPLPALYAIRYHSFYAAHKEHAYDFLMNDQDRDMWKWVEEFNKYDLYTKDEMSLIDVDSVKEYYKTLISKYFPEKIGW